MSSDDPDPKLWPFEARVNLDDGGSEFHQHARDNGDGTVTVCEFRLSEGYVERIYPADKVKLSERPWEKAQRWYELYKQRLRWVDWLEIRNREGSRFQQGNEPISIHPEEEERDDGPR